MKEIINENKNDSTTVSVTQVQTVTDQKNDHLKDEILELKK